MMKKLSIIGLALLTMSFSAFSGGRDEQIDPNPLLTCYQELKVTEGAWRSAAESLKSCVESRNGIVENLRRLEEENQDLKRRLDDALKK